MGRAVEMMGTTHGEWQVMSKAESTTKHTKWLCKCLGCGTEKTLDGSMLRQHRSKSCGCKKAELLSARNLKHGLSHTKMYRIHSNMKSMINNYYHTLYPTHGEKGITYDPAWETFANFYDWAIHNGFSEQTSTLARHNRNENFNPTNCYWR